MERLNEIIRRQGGRDNGRNNGLDKSSPYGTSSQSPRTDGMPGHRPLPEQNARLGQYSNAPRPQQTGTTNRSVTPPSRNQYSAPPTRSQGNAGSKAHYMPGQRSAGERYTPAPERNSWPQANSAPTRRAETYRPALQGDAQRNWSGEWEEDTAPIQYGDWESDGYDEAAPARDASESYVLNRASARIAQTYPRNQRSMVTRELRSQMDDEIEPSVTPHAREERLPIPLPPSQLTQRGEQSHRLTQPLNRSAAMVPINQYSPKATIPARPQSQRELPTPLIPAPYVAKNSICPICKGAGYLRADVPYGHPNFGKPIACKCKDAERAEKRRQQLQSLSNLGELKDKTFENFHPNVSRAVEDAFNAAIDYADDPRGWLLLTGRVGCGKTHLAAAIANQSLDRGSRVLFSTVIDLLDHLRNAYSPSATEVYDRVLDNMREAELLVLDDLGAQQSTPWATEKLFQLLNFRYNYCMPTVITTNNLGLQGIDERLRSRMTDSGLVTVVVIDRTVDYRPRNPRHV